MSDEGRGQSASEGRGRSPGLRGRSARFWTLSGLTVLGAVVFLQNTGTTPVHVLVWDINMPLVFLLLAMVALGIGVDRLWLWRQRRQRL